MPRKEMIELGKDDRQVADFLELVRARGQAHVNVNGEVLTVKVSRDAVTKEAREFLTKGGPAND
jgi:hypothetical protein